MILIGYIFGIKYDRRLCEDITCNVAYRWYCKLNLDDDVPDHSSLSKIRDRYGSEVFKNFFDKVVEECRINGLVKGESIMTDGSLIDANASIDSMIAKDEDIAKAEVNALKERKATDRMPNRKISNETHISKSDPDSSLAKKEGTARALRYKMHSTIDADSRVILDSQITTGATHDTKVYLERIKYIKTKYKLNIKEAIADRGYGAIDNIKSLNEEGITTYIPLFSNRSGSTAKEMADAGFKYDYTNDRYMYPEGKIMYPKRHKDTTSYHAKISTCKTCPSFTACVAKSRKGGEKVVLRNPNQDLFEKEILRMQEEIFHKKLKERMWKIEGIFSEAKNMHGLSRAKYRGLQKMQIQAHMTSATQNLKRLVISLTPTFITVLLQYISLGFWKSIIYTIKYKTSNSFSYI
jgi:IS5 family transposase